MSAPVPVSTWHELRALVAEGGCAAALPASVVVDGPVPVGPGRSLDVMGCATSVRFAPGVSQMFSVADGGRLRLAGSLLVTPGTGAAPLLSVDGGGRLDLDCALLARPGAPGTPAPSSCLVDCRGTANLGPCSALDGWVAAPSEAEPSPCALRVSGQGAVARMGGGRVSGCTSLGTEAAPGAAVQVLDGACLLIEAGSVQDNCRQEGDGVLYGGGVYVDKATLSMTGGSVEGNRAVHGAGVYCVGRGLVEVSGGRIANNRALHRGGGLYSTGTVLLEGGDVADNRASFGGGVFNAGTLHERSAVVSGNTADSGAGVYNRGTASVEGGSIVGNAADGVQGSGGGVYNTGRLVLGEGIIAGNRALYTGGGLYNTRSGTVDVDGAGLSNNRALYGGGIYNARGRVAIATGDIVDNCANSTQFGGGGIYNTGLLSCDRATIVHNASQGMGGGIYNVGSVRLGASGLSHNAAMSGGALYNRGSAEAERAVIVHNAAGDMGGGVVNSGSLELAGGTVAHNSARRGGGILNAGTASVVGALVGRNTAETANDFYNYLDDGSRGTFTLDAPDDDPSLAALGWCEEGAAGTASRFVLDSEERRLSAAPVWEVRFMAADGSDPAVTLVEPGAVLDRPDDGGTDWVDDATGLLWDFDEPVERDLTLLALDPDVEGELDGAGADGDGAAHRDAGDDPEGAGAPGDSGAGPRAAPGPRGGGRGGAITGAIVIAATAAGRISGRMRRRGRTGGPKEG
ncbi:hypothetical protein [Caniella muris]|uniref:hypothetical protein n=1 Tax=Caniella muris TaxID=2941502 RepID=UPI00203D4B89|nr:hypothetical protein [Caniella muris]